MHTSVCVCVCLSVCMYITHIVILVFLEGLDVVGMFLQQKRFCGWVVRYLHILNWSTSLCSIIHTEDMPTNHVK